MFTQVIQLCSCNQIDLCACVHWLILFIEQVAKFKAESYYTVIGDFDAVPFHIKNHDVQMLRPYEDKL